MICYRRHSSLLPFVFAAITLQSWWGLQNAILVGGATKVKDPSITNDVPSSSRAILLRRSQDKRALENLVDNIYQRNTWFDTERKPPLNGNGRRRRARKAEQSEDLLWPKAEVPYIVGETRRLDFEELLNQSFEAFHVYTCIRFRPKRSDDNDYINIVNTADCTTFLGRQGGMQNLTLSPACCRKKLIIQALGYAIGFISQHTRPDRDEYITIRFEDLRPERHLEFKKYSTNETDMYGVPYDYLSIMHFGPFASSKAGNITIETKNRSYQTVIGRSTHLSFRDAKLANMMYRCYEVNGCKDITCPGEGFVGQDCQCWCPSEHNNRTAEPCADNTTCEDITCSEEGLLAEMYPWRFSSGHCNNTSENCAGEQTDVAWSIGRLAALTVGFVVSLSIIVAVATYVVYRRRQLRVKISTSQSPAAENEVVQSHDVPKQYLTLEHQSTALNYEVISTDQPIDNPLQPNADRASYHELDLYDIVLH